jgi:hypothetical protein
MEPKKTQVFVNREEYQKTPHDRYLSKKKNRILPDLTPEQMGMVNRSEIDLFDPIFDGMTLHTKLFIIAYVGEAAGNGRLARKMAGFQSTYEHAVHSMLKSQKTRRAIKSLMQDDPLIANVWERQRMLTTLARSNGETTGDRIKAIDMLNKMQGTYITTVVIEESTPDRSWTIIGKDGNKIEDADFSVLEQDTSPETGKVEQITNQTRGTA